MTAGDIPGVKTVARRTWAHTYRGVIPEPVQQKYLNLAYSQEALERRLRSGIFLVAERQTEIVGFAQFVPVAGTEGEVDLVAIYVLPEAQGRGAGSKLLDAGIRALGDVRRVRVRVERDNTVGRGFYDARGFRLVRESVDEFEGHSFNMVELVLEIKQTSDEG